MYPTPEAFGRAMSFAINQAVEKQRAFSYIKNGPSYLRPAKSKYGLFKNGKPRKTKHRPWAPVFRKAKFKSVKPSSCSKCLRGDLPLEAHHLVPLAQLKALGIALVEAEHKILWLCPLCHLQEHQGEPVAKIMQKRILELLSSPPRD